MTIPEPVTIPEAFRRQVALRPDAVAVATAAERLSYAELDRRSQDLARDLVAAGVRAGDRVLVCLERSAGLVVGLLAVLKARAAYLPVDLGEAPARLAGILADAEVRLALCDTAGAALLENQDVPVLREGGGAARPEPSDEGGAAPGPPITPELPAAPEDLACIMYTSGSTGRPKGVMVPHRAVLNLVTEPNYVTLTPEDRVLHLAPVAFDAATFEIWGALLNGARLEPAPASPVGPQELGALLRERRISVLWLTAALFHRQIDFSPESLSGARVVLAGGDVLSVEHVRKLRAAAPDLEIVNGYGPTEATTFSVCHRIAPDEEFAHSVPIGVPIQGASAELRDESGTAVDEGVEGAEGELWIAGAGVAHGYWRRPDLTAERFVADAAGRTWYRTGDLARRRADGVLEFLGRIDGQFKLRGHRVEPGEIENLLAAHPQVRQAAVGVRDNLVGDPKLVAWVTTTGPLDRKALRAYVRERLPEYMVPTVFATVDALPVTANGKVDRPALPTPDWRRKENYV
ncbi:amino acid adenylation domain-containing protein [Streptomyces lutosisoli]|uniref:Amino acid adenylation domain-containing protein n=1 Tax=Streptomyces lutosisoli TaxID=2665721 RepID=A0ABW2VPC1_9ACTN